MLKSNYTDDKIEAGCDEAGRGCLAGPVVAAAVIFPKNYINTKLNDSKKLTEKERNELRIVIENEALSFGVAWVDNNAIDEINILNASILAMQNAVDNLKIKPELLLIDGNRFKQHKNYKHVCIIKGDGKYLSIAAASIIAKTYRDEFMNKAHQQYSQYKWNSNKGYPTIEHKLAIFSNGLTPLHRKTFNVAIQTKLDF